MNAALSSRDLGDFEEAWAAGGPVILRLSFRDLG